MTAPNLIFAVIWISCTRLDGVDVGTDPRIALAIAYREFGLDPDYLLDAVAGDESTLVDEPQVRSSAPKSAQGASLQERIDSARARNDWGEVNQLLKEKFSS